MDTQESFKIIDDLVFGQTGKHLDTLQLGILKSVFNGQKYSKIAQEYHCTEGHARDKAYELWQILSKALGEELNKSNVRATMERVIATNSNVFVNPSRIGSINVCPNPIQYSENPEVDNLDIIEIEDFSIEEKLNQAKSKSVPRLAQLGLTAEQISQALDLDLQLVLENFKK